MKNHNSEKEKFDVAVIGGGPAGMMAAGRAAELGAKVILLEKNKLPGAKLLLTGKGRCNITNRTTPRAIVEIIGKKGRFLFSALSKFGIDDAIIFFETRNVATKLERGNRIFPQSDQALDVVNALVGYARKNNVIIRGNAAVSSIICNNDKIEKITLSDGKEILASEFILCTGGKSYPKTGSTGDGYGWLKKLGHTVVNPTPALTPIITEGTITRKLEGLSLKNVEISIFKNNKKIDSKFGEALFTSDGMSGPIILEMSKKINEELPAKLELHIDFKPALDHTKLDNRLQRDFQRMNNKMFKNSLEDLLPQKLIPIIIDLSGIDPAKKVNLVTREERKTILRLIKEFSLAIKETAGFDKAIITAGGVDLREVDSQTMKSKIIKNLFFAGEILDLDAPTGGYNLQICWSTGYVAGENAASFFFQKHELE